MAFLMQRNPRLTVFYFLKTNNKHKEEIYLLIYYKLNRAEQIYIKQRVFILGMAIRTLRTII